MRHRQNLFGPKVVEGAAASSKEGIDCWMQWVMDDISAAKNYVERLARRFQTEDQILLHYIFKRANLRISKKIISELKRETIVKIKNASSEDPSSTTEGDMDRLLMQSISTSFIDQMCDADSVSSSISEFSIDECVNVSDQTPQMLTVFVSHLPATQVEKIMSHIKPETLQEFFKHKNLSPKHGRDWCKKRKAQCKRCA